MIDKRVKNLAAAVAGIKSGSTVLCAGFGSGGEAIELIEALIPLGVKDLTVVANNAGTGETGIAALIREGRVRKVICSYPRTIELELVPQGTLSERMRAAAAGIGGFYTPTGAESKLAAGKETKIIDGRTYVLEKPLKGDVALIRGLKSDRWGNLVYRKSARNFNPVMAAAAALTVAQVREVVDLGALDPETVVTPGIFVDRVVVV